MTVEYRVKIVREHRLPRALHAQRMDFRCFVLIAARVANADPYLDVNVPSAVGVPAPPAGMERAVASLARNLAAALLGKDRADELVAYLATLPYHRPEFVSVTQKRLC